MERVSRWFDPAAGFAVAMLALIGLVKAQEIRDVSPVDVTLLAFGLCVVLCAVAVVVRRRLPVEVLWVLAFLATLVPAMLVGGDNAYGDSKDRELLTLVPACLIAPLILLERERALRWFLGVVVATAVIPACVVLVTGVDPTYGRATVSDLNPINVGRVVAGAAVVLAVVVLRERRRWFRAAASVGVVVLLYVEWQTGSRGPLLAAVFGIGLVVAVDLGERLTRRQRAITAVGVVVLVVVGAVAMFTASWSPMSRDTGESDSMRLELYERSLELTASHPLGIGWGNLIDHLRPGQIIEAQGDTQYAHNIVLEVAAEGGWLALVALLALIGVSFRRIFAGRHTLVGAALLGLWVFALSVAMVSSDFPGNRLTLVMLGVGLLRPTPSKSLTDPAGARDAGLLDVQGGRRATIGATPEGPDASREGGGAGAGLVDESTAALREQGHERG